MQGRLWISEHHEKKSLTGVGGGVDGGRLSSGSNCMNNILTDAYSVWKWMGYALANVPKLILSDCTITMVQNS
jgi:hypothetical protein